MTLERIEHKVFASEAPLDEMGQFGSALATTKLNTKDVAEIQALPAYTKGWGSAIISENNYPAMEEMNGVLNVMSYHTGYLYQEGIPTYSATQEYSVTSWVKDLAGEKVYKSLQGGNKGHDLIDPAWWEELKLGGGGLEIGDIGIAPLGIDETKGKRRYLNGQLIIQEQYAQFTAKVKSAIELYPSLSITEDEWQTLSTMTVGGQVGRFVVDDEAGTIRLPKIIMPIQGLTDLSKLGQIVEAGLPTHTHTRGSMNITGNIYGLEQGSADGAFTSSDWKLLGNDGADCQLRKASFNASKTWTGSTSEPNNATYGKSNTVQQQQIQYPYFIQVATGAETEDNIINEIELNNPYSLLDVKWSDKLLNNISWLRSEGQANSKSIYNDVYELILKEYNSGTDETETVGGINITFRRGSETNIKVTTNKSAYDSILLATGTAWYYVIDTANETFYLPQSDGFLQFGGNGNFVEAGLPNIDGYVDVIGISSRDAVESGPYKQTMVADNLAFQNISNNDFSQVVWNFDASRANPIYSNSNTVQPNAVKGYLYFYVGETVQNANLVNIGRIQETMVTRPMVDGQWVNKALVLASNVACPNSDLTLDLSSWLPNDGYIYEILCDTAGSTGSTSGNRAGIAVTSDILLDNGFNVVTAQTRSASTVSFASSFTIPIGTARYLRLVNGVGTNTGTFTLTARAYRRLGTNL